MPASFFWDAPGGSVVIIQRSLTFMSIVVVQVYVFDLVCWHTKNMPQCGPWFVYISFLYRVFWMYPYLLLLRMYFQMSFVYFPPVLLCIILMCGVGLPSRELGRHICRLNNRSCFLLNGCYLLVGYIILFNMVKFYLFFLVITFLLIKLPKFYFSS